jgi:hypothetical protein
VPTWSALLGGSTNSLNSTDPDHTRERPSWSEEWKRLGLGAKLVEYRDVGIRGGDGSRTPTASLLPSDLYFVQIGFGVDQHGDCTDATKAATRAVRNAIEFNSIPGVIQHIPGGRREMIIHVKLGVPSYHRDDAGNGDGGPSVGNGANVSVDVLQVAKVFPYGKLLPIQIVRGGLEFHSGRVVEELGDTNDVGICVVACVSIGHHNRCDADEDVEKDGRANSQQHHKTFNTKDGY